MCEHIVRVISTNKEWKGNLSNLQMIKVDRNADQASYEWNAGYAGPRSESQTIVANKAHCTDIRLEYQTEIIPVLCAALCTVHGVLYSKLVRCDVTWPGQCSNASSERTA